MQILHILYNLLASPPLSHLLIILFVFFITYARLLGKDYFWCIDDIDGIARFSERLEVKKNEKGEIVESRKIDAYDIGDGPTKKVVRFLSFIPELGFPGCVMRYVRLHIGKKLKVLGQNEKGHDVWGFTQSPRRHHLLSMAVQALCLTAGYFFLLPYTGSQIAFLTCLLYSAHPYTTQTVAWISGINYSLSMLAFLCAANVAIYVHDLHYAIPLVIASAAASSFFVYIGCFGWLILWFLKFNWHAFAYAVPAILIFLYKGKETMDYRLKNFKEQNMTATTFWKWRKPIVMIKTLWYYFSKIFMPVQMGLYHTWGYFYEEPIERVNGMFWKGILALGAVIAGFYFGCLPIRIGIIWFFTFFLLFSNFITAQQFVADRYVAVPSFGICLILATLFHASPLIWIILGLYAMRTFCHLPTFKNEIDYYLSNFLNFRKSEVALGNLGAAYMNSQMHGSAVDTWTMATKVNPGYDVPWYNLYSILRANGRHDEALHHMKKCLDAKVVHFDKRWREEYELYKAALAGGIKNNEAASKLFEEAKGFFEKKDYIAEKAVLLQMLTIDSSGIAPEMINNVKGRLAEIERASIQLHNPVQQAGS